MRIVSGKKINALFALILAVASLCGCKIGVHEDLYAIATAKTRFVAPAVIAPGTGEEYVFTIANVPVVEIACAESGAQVFYSLDGAEYQAYTGPFPLPVADPKADQSYSLSAYSAHPDYEQSPVIIQAYRFVASAVPTPVISPSAGYYEYNDGNAPTVTLSSGLTGAQLYFSIDGAPSQAYTGPFTLPFPANTAAPGTVTLTAYATHSDYLDSAVATQVYSYVTRVLVPSITTEPATYYQFNKPPTIAVSCAQAGVTFHYSVDGSTWQTASSSSFILPVPASWSSPQDVTVRVYASAPGYLDSTIATSAAYRFLPSGSIVTIAGTGSIGFTGDGGPATSATLNNPLSVYVDASGNVYFADSQNYCVRKIDAATGNISTLAGVCGVTGPVSEGVPAAGAHLGQLLGITSDGTLLYIADMDYNVVWTVPLAGGNLVRYAGQPLSMGHASDLTPRLAAELDTPCALFYDSDSGDLYISELMSFDVQRIVAGTYIETVAGNGTSLSIGDGFPATTASMETPMGIAMMSDGSLIIGDYGAGTIRSVDLAGTKNISTVLSGLSFPSQVVADGTGFYFSERGANRISFYDGTTVTTVAGTGVSGFSGDRGPATSATLTSPWGFFVTAGKEIYIADTNNQRIRKVLKY